jgi:hypothetical protein
MSEIKTVPTLTTLMLILPIKTVSEANNRDNWRKKRTRRIAQQREVNIEWKREARGRKVKLPCVVKFTRIAPRKLDDDNLRSAFKGIRDEVARLLGVDDGGDQVKWEYEQLPRGSHQYDVFIEVRSWRPSPCS